ncbi:MAG: M13 family metallopeptidase [Pirellulaceae bacterium]|nr:M13 family metallopeptidase [Pirellulaceae bacterium]
MGKLTRVGLAMVVMAAGVGVGPYVRAAEPAEGKGVSGIELKNISKTISPGTDFYEYVNENWLKSTEIPADRSNYGSFSVLEDETKAAIRTLIEAAAADKNAAPGSDAQKVGDFYRSLTNLELREKLGTKPIQGLLDEIAAVKSVAELSKVAGSLQRKGVVGVMAGYISPDARKSDQYTVYLTQAGITLPDRDYYLSDEPRFADIRKGLQVYMQDMLTAFKHPKPAETAEQLLALEKKIAAIQWARVENRDPVKTYNKVNQEELAGQMSNFAMKAYLEVLGVSKQYEFIVRQPSFIEGVNKLLVEVPLDTWKDYYTFRVIDAYAMDLTEALEKRHFQFHETLLSGVEEQKPLWKKGVEACDRVLGEIVGKLYVDKHFPPRAKERMKELVDNLKGAFAQRIDGLEWMSPVTKKQAHEKLSKFTTKIGYPDVWKDYSKLVIKADDLVGNYMRAAEVEFQRDVDRLGGPIDRTEWGMTPQTINAYYNPVMNEIVFPAAILQPPFFNLDADDAVNYGGIGGVIGHEISHGFDDKGSEYDGDGNLRKWWSIEDREEFERRAQQLTDQYNAYKPFEDMSVNGKLTLGENIGDLGGMACAYAAYRLSLGGKEAPVIDGLTGDQRFFLGWGQIWRRLYREPELRKRLITDPHSPSQYRANGIVSNMDAFYKAFEIKPTDPMYIAPEKRVRIW